MSILPKKLSSGCLTFRRDDIIIADWRNLREDRRHPGLAGLAYMKTYFVINPAAGSGIDTNSLIPSVTEAAVNCGQEVFFYETKCVGDAERFTKELLAENTSEELRFIACGGDGTFNEILNGAIGSPNAVISVFPSGTGNDFVRNFTEAGDFRDINALLQGSVIDCDAIEYSGVIDGDFRIRYCGNMFNIGFDCNVVDKTSELKTKPLISGSFAYLMGVAVTLIKKKGADLKIVADGKVLCDGPLLLTSIANGSYCGGGVKSNPYADVQDGKIDISVIKDLGRLRFITLFPKYQKGTHLDAPNIDDLVTNLKAEEITITPRRGVMRLCVDGEIYTTEGILFRIQPGAFRLLVPKKP